VFSISQIYFPEMTSLFFEPRNLAKSEVNTQQASRIENPKELELTLDTNIGAGC
jgi:hypothetical protein